mmetsp:Transcript_15423/g.36005  ORF Transcript_15423/g.36005 Transcript_15423/m.36005 type:complete len:214 (+) Transcript_15423:803-1444(+)
MVGLLGSMTKMRLSRTRPPGPGRLCPGAITSSFANVLLPISSETQHICTGLVSSRFSLQKHCEHLSVPCGGFLHLVPWTQCMFVRTHAWCAWAAPTTVSTPLTARARYQGPRYLGNPWSPARRFCKWRASGNSALMHWSMTRAMGLWSASIPAAACIIHDAIMQKRSMWRWFHPFPLHSVTANAAVVSPKIPAFCVCRGALRRLRLVCGIPRR